MLQYTRLAVVGVKGHSTLGGIQEEGNYLANLDSNKELDNHKQTLTEVHGMVLINILLYLQTMIDNQLNDCEVCAENDIRKTITTPVGHIPTPERPFRHQVLDYVEMIKSV